MDQEGSVLPMKAEDSGAGLHARTGHGQLPGFVQRHDGANLKD